PHAPGTGLATRAVDGTDPDGPEDEPAATGRITLPAVLTPGRVLLLVALLIVLLYHGNLILAGSYQRTYDAFVHIFLGDHYRRWWWSSWDHRWYTGFPVISYPPATHQSIALLSRLVGLQGAFALVQLFALFNLTVGVYRWARIWVDERSAGWAAILLATSSAIAETVHVFGQLPTTFSLAFLLQALPFVHRWTRDGGLRYLVLGVAATAACTGGHHVTTLFGSVFFVAPVMLAALVENLRTPLADEPAAYCDTVDRRNLWPLVARRLRRVVPTILRGAVYGVLLIAALLIVVLPYWIWSATDPITQVSIPHASRDSFIENTAAGLVFWVVPWGVTLVALPYALIRGTASKAWPLTACLAALTFFGTGGTTPFPRMLLGGAFDILTLDRFTFWATISILPLAGQFVNSLYLGSVGRKLDAELGRVVSALVRVLLALAYLGFTVFSANLTHYRPFQPATIDIDPIVAFIDKDEHDRWRYLTLGFGDQMAWLGANTTAATVDGNYHSARRLPELTSRPIERLEGAKFSGVPGLGSLQQFLTAPSRYSLKYVFSNDRFYDPLLHFSGWHELGLLENGIAVWERADVPPLPTEPYERQIPAWQRLLWGTVPLGSGAAALVGLVWFALGTPLPRAVGATNRWVRRLYERTPLARRARRLEQRLARDAARVGGRDTPRDWKDWIPLLSRYDAWTRREVPRRRKAIQAGLVLVALLAALAATLRPEPPAGPTEVVTSYYDHLDFRRFDDALDLLDPRTRPDPAEFRSQLTVDGGLVASFAKLDSVRPTIVSRSEGHAVVRVDLEYLTSIERYSTRTEVEVRELDGRWYLEPPPADVTEPPERFTSRPAIEFLAESGGTTGEDSLADNSPDRPQVTFESVRSLHVEGNWVVVGEVTNVDVDPADVTVNAQLRDPDGELLATYDAAQVMVHKLLPGESTPFRLVFESLAGTGAGGDADADTPRDDNAADATAAATTTTMTTTTAGPGATADKGPVEFDPYAITPLWLPDGAVVASVDVYARAVLTPLGTERGLQVVDLRRETDASGAGYLVGTLRNDGTREAAVPHLLVAYRDDAGDVAWVEDAYLPSSIRPQRSAEFRVPLADADALEPTGLATTAYADDAGVDRSRLGLVPPMIQLGPGADFASVDVVPSAYYRAGG
ncbi:MAG: hypothetical protein S0880_03140, partial [Actinomycetota bacterium]|nr:hypothetical protein [Actinomycetota bacterium]